MKDLRTECVRFNVVLLNLYDQFLPIHFSFDNSFTLCLLKGFYFIIRFFHNSWNNDTANFFFISIATDTCGWLFHKSRRNGRRKNIIQDVQLITRLQTLSWRTKCRILVLLKLFRFPNWFVFLTSIGLILPSNDNLVKWKKMHQLDCLIQIL